MSPPSLIKLGTPFLATCVCVGAGKGEGGVGVAMGLTGLGFGRPARPLAKVDERLMVRRTEALNVAAAAAFAITSGNIGNGCRPVSARALCTRLRGGGGGSTMAGPNDYSSTLQDQSQPWWGEEKKTNLMRPVGQTKGGGFFLGSTRGSASASSKKSGTPKSNTLRSQAGRTGGDMTESLGTKEWLALAALPAAFLFGNKGETTAGGQKSRKPPPPTQADKSRKATPATKSQRGGHVITAATAKGKERGRGSALAVQGRRKQSMAPRGGSRAAGSGMSLVPANPYLRAAGIMAIAALGCGGLYSLQAGNLLRSAWPISFLDPWQVLTAVTWAVNMKATFAGGRLDGSSSRSNAPQTVNFFTPAGWAFTIWAPIFLGEALFVAFQLLPFPSIRGSWWLSDISPWFAGAMLFQTMWCLSFRPWARDAGLLWVPALLLGGVAVALGGVHSILREAWFNRDMEVPQYLLSHLPLSLHFGWISCAALVNINGYFASVKRLTNRFKLVMSVATIVGAVLLGAGVTLVREDPIYAAVVAWALWAVGSPAGWEGLKGKVDPGAIRVQELAAKMGSALAFSAASIPLGLSIKDTITGAGQDPYDETY